MVRLMEKAIIAVDAGGTKTHASLINKDKEIIGSVFGEPGSPAAVGIDKAFSNIFVAIQRLYEHYARCYEIVFIQLGISGLGIVPDPLLYRDRFAEAFKVRVRINDDGFLALHSLMQNRPGHWITIIAGTGSCCYGTNGKDTLLLGGFGHLLTEAGSAYVCVKSLMSEAIRQFEENEPLSPLSRSFMNEIAACDVYRFKVFAFNNSKGKIASYAPLVSAAALAGDEQAAAILRQCGRDLARWVKLMYRHLQLAESTVLGFRGSFIENAAYVKDELIAGLHKDGIYPDIVKNSDDPIYGAYYLALKEGVI